MTIALAIARLREQAPAITADDHWIVGQANGEIWIYVNDPARVTCAIGDVYTTYIACLIGETVARVVHYRSRRGADGDQTLPP